MGNWSFGTSLESMTNVLICSPRDQAILEAEYKQNPKPNKAARAEIVEKVSLSEKEVQVSSPI
jgi:Homeodomain